MTLQCKRADAFVLYICWNSLFSYTSFEGLKSEGIYRVSGFADDIEVLKNLYDKGNLYMLMSNMLSIFGQSIFEIGLSLKLEQSFFQIRNML